MAAGVEVLGGRGRRRSTLRELPPAWRPSAAALVAGAGATSLVAVVPALEGAGGLPALRPVLEGAAAVIAAGAALLALGRHRQGPTVAGALLIAGLLAFATGDALCALEPAVLTLGVPPQATAWSGRAGLLLGAGLVLASSAVPAAPARRPGAIAAAIAAAGGLVVGGVALAATQGRLGPPVVVATGVHVTGAALLAGAAVACAARARLEADGVLRWLAGACVLLVFARVHAALHVPIRTADVHVGDAFRVGAYALLGTGCATAIAEQWRARAEAAVAEERRRIARDLHDSVAQELAYIARRSGPAPEVAAAAQRGLAASRDTIAQLRASSTVPLASALEQAALLAARRTGLRIELDVDATAQAAGDAQALLVRALVVAADNAAEHGGAARLRVELRNRFGLVLLAHDDGTGPPGTPDGERRARGFGLHGLAEEAAALRGSVRLRSGRAGTTLEVRVPCTPS